MQTELLIVHFVYDACNFVCAKYFLIYRSNAEEAELKDLKPGVEYHAKYDFFYVAVTASPSLDKSLCSQMFCDVHSCVVLTNWIRPP